MGFSQGAQPHPLPICAWTSPLGAPSPSRLAAFFREERTRNFSGRFAGKEVSRNPDFASKNGVSSEIAGTVGTIARAAPPNTLDA